MLDAEKLKILTEQKKTFTNTSDFAKLQFKQAAATGIFKICVAKEYGGFGKTFQTLCSELQSIGYATQSTGLILAINAHLWGFIFPLLHFTDGKLQKKLLEPALAGKIIGGHAITEANAGSDLTKMESKLVETADSFIINGNKRYITNATIADYLITYVKHDNYFSAVLIEPQRDACLIEQQYRVVSCVDADMGEIYFQNTVIPKSRLIGKPKAGMTLIQFAMEYERAFIFAGLLGCMQWHMDQLKLYIRQRKIKQSSLSQLTTVSHKMAELQVKLSSMQLWLDRCAQLKDSQQRITLESAYTKLFCGETFLSMSIDITHLFGACGLESKARSNLLVNDALAARLFSGSSEIQKEIISQFNGFCY